MRYNDDNCRMEGIFLSLGSNLGNRLNNLKEARELIYDTVGKVIATSSLYRTDPWGVTDQPEFYNLVMMIESELPPSILLERLLDAEKEMGRVREKKWGARLIDIDLLFYHNQVLNLPHIIIPHPQIPFRRFVLEPMAEIAPAFIHPVLHKNIATLLAECGDVAAVHKTEDPL